MRGEENAAPMMQGRCSRKGEGDQVENSEAAVLRHMWYVEVGVAGVALFIQASIVHAEMNIFASTRTTPDVCPRGSDARSVAREMAHTVEVLDE